MATRMGENAGTFEQSVDPEPLAIEEGMAATGMIKSTYGDHLTASFS